MREVFSGPQNVGDQERISARMAVSSGEVVLVVLHCK